MIEKKISRNRELDALWDYYSILEDVGTCPNGWREEITEEKYAIPFDEAERIGGMIFFPYAKPKQRIGDISVHIGHEGRSPAGII